MSIRFPGRNPWIALSVIGVAAASLAVSGFESSRRYDQKNMLWNRLPHVQTQEVVQVELPRPTPPIIDPASIDRITALVRRLTPAPSVAAASAGLRVVRIVFTDGGVIRLSFPLSAAGQTFLTGIATNEVTSVGVASRDAQAWNAVLDGRTVPPRFCKPKQ